MPWLKPGQSNVPNSTLRDQWARGSRQRRYVGGSVPYEYWHSEDGSPPPNAVLGTPQESEDQRAVRKLLDLAEKAEPDHTSQEGEPAPERSAEAPSDDVERIVWLSDIHAPEHDRDAVAAVISLLEEMQPHRVVLGGDILELESCSQHGGVARPASLLEDIAAGHELLDQLQSACPASDFDFLEGNHETRLTRKTVRQFPELAGACTLPGLLNLRGRGIRWHSFDSVLRIGKIAFTHGWWANKHHAAKHLLEMGESVAYGHTHRAQVHVAGGPHGPRGAYGLGCLRDLNPSWLCGRPSPWSQGFGICYVDRNTGDYNMYPVTIHNGRFRWNGRTYDGRS